MAENTFHVIYFTLRLIMKSRKLNAVPRTIFCSEKVKVTIQNEKELVGSSPLCKLESSPDNNGTWYTELLRHTFVLQESPALNLHPEY